MNNLVSIIVPIYNAEKHLDRCIDSVVNQSYNDIELILINDGSIDNSKKICDSYASIHKNIYVIDKENSGPADCRNIGIKESNGEFIFFLDSDDVIEKNTIELLVHNINTSKTDMVVSDFMKESNSTYQNSGHNKFFTNDKILEQKDIIDYTRSYLMSPNKFPLFTYCWGRLFRASIIKDNNISFNDKLRTFEDVCFNFKYLKYTNSLYFLDKPLYTLLIHTTHLSTTMNMKDEPSVLFGYFEALNSVKDFLGISRTIEMKEEISRSYVCYTIIQFIRICLQINNKNKRKIYNYIHSVINDVEFRNNLKSYSPLPGESKIIPFLMRIRFVWLIMFFCRKRAQDRYNINIY